MVDASAKLTSGILNGNIDQYGDFDLCLSSKPRGESFRSQYCLVSLQLTLPAAEQHLQQLRRLTLGNEPYESEFEDVRQKLTLKPVPSLMFDIVLLGGALRSQIF